MWRGETAMGRVWRTVVVLVLLPVFGCGSPTAAPASAALPTSLKIVAGDTGAPVPGAQVTVGGASVVTSASGEVVLDDRAVGREAVRVDSAGFLRRETVLGGGTVSLWPTRASYPEQYVESLIYRPSSSAAALANGPDHPLNRVMAARVSLATTAVLRADPQAMAVLQSSAAVITEATGGQVEFALDDPSAPVVFSVVIDDHARDGALTLRRVRNDVIEGGSVTFSRRPGFEPAHDVRYVVHELGHVLGLEHSMVPTDMMYYTVLPDSPITFTENERITIRLLLQRSPGNLYPDRDGAVGLAS
jgi:hypothetical protein